MKEYPELQSLIESAQRGDEESFRVLYSVLSPKVFRFIRPRAGNRSSALDALQETFIDFWRGLSRFKYMGEGALMAFLLRIASRKLSRSFRFFRSSVSLESVEDLVAHEPEAPASAVLDVARILATLGQRDREIIVLRSLEDRPFAEIAELLGESENALKVRHHRALARIRKKTGYE